MKLNFIKTILNPKVAGIVSAVGSAVIAFASSMDERKKAEEFKRLVERVEALENKK